MGFPLPKGSLKNWYPGWPGDLWSYLVRLVQASTAASVWTPISLTISSASPPQNIPLPLRPASTPLSPAKLLAQVPVAAGYPLDHQTYALQVPGATPAPGDYQPGDIVRLMFSQAQLSAGPCNVTVQSGGVGTPVLGHIFASAVTQFGYLDVMLGPEGASQNWTLVGGGAF